MKIANKVYQPDVVDTNEKSSLSCRLAGIQGSRIRLFGM